MTTPNVSITVAGTPTTGWQDSIYQWGETPVALSYSYEADGGVQTSKRYFILRVEEDRTVYIAKSQCVNAHSGGRGGLLVVALAVPRGYKLATHTPYRALTLLFDTFTARCMTPRRDMYGQDYWEYNAQIPKGALDDVCQEICLRSASGSHRAMNPQGQDTSLIVPETKMDAFFADPMYPELAPYKQALIKADEPQEKLLPGMTIPRTVKWKVKVMDNGEPYTIQVNGVGRQPVGGMVEVSDPTARIRCAGSRPREYYTNDEKAFTIGGEQGIREMSMVGVQVDEANETITVTLKRTTALTKRYYIAFEDKDAALAFRRKPFFKLTLNNYKQISTRQDRDGGLFFELTGEDIGERRSIKVEGNGQDSDYEVTRTQWEGEELRIKTRLVVKTPPAPPVPRGAVRGHNPVPPPQIERTVPCLTIELQEGEFRRIKDIEQTSQRVVIEEKPDGDDYLVMKLDTLFRHPADKGKEAYATEIPLGKDWVTRFVNVEVHLDNGQILKTAEAKKISAQGAQLTQEDFEPAPLMFIMGRFLRRWGGYLLLALLCFAAGAICQYRFGWGNDLGGRIVAPTDTVNGQVTNPAPDETPDPTQPKGDEVPTTDPFAQKMEEAKACLAKKELTFDEVQDLYNTVYLSMDATQYQAVDSTTFQAIKDYQDIVGWIVRADSLSELRKIARNTRPSNINQSHLDMVKKIFHESTNWTTNKEYSGRYRSFTSFQELNSIKQDTGPQPKQPSVTPR